MASLDSKSAPDKQSFSNPVPPKPRHIPRILTALSHLSTPFINTFILVHLSAPVLANVGGSSLSSQVLLLGREVYQGVMSEPWLLFAPLGVHIAAGVSKRLLSDKPIPRRPRLITLTAYPLVAFLSIHVLTHRFYPMSSVLPISNLSPSELDYEFVKYGLTKWPIRSWLLYGGLVLTGITHAFEGWVIIRRTWVGGQGMGPRMRKIVAALSIGAVLSGLVCLAKEPLFCLQSTLARIDATYLNSILYRV